jgi:sugar O-acyltransferase (sialic acid O-acetyltransferase NeuD family)
VKKILIICAGDTSHVVIDIVEKQALYRIAGILDVQLKKNARFNDYRILGDEREIRTIVRRHGIYGGVVANGDNCLRFKIVERIRRTCPQFRFVAAIHPSAQVSKGVQIGAGSVIMAGVVINANTTIGEHCLLNTKSSIDHDSVMGDFSSLAPGATLGGRSRVGKFTGVSLGANVINGVTVGENTVIGAGALVLADVPSNVMAYGIPCKVVRKRKFGEKYF